MTFSPIGLLVLLLAAGLACTTATPRAPEQAAASPGAAAAPRPIFRYVQLGPGRAVLGEPLPEPLRAAVGAAPGDTVVPLPRGTFSGAERITLYLTPAGVVRGTVFDYVHGADFEAMVRDYAADLGAPARSQDRRPGEEAADVAAWEDARTILVLRRDPNRSAWTVRAELWDRLLRGP